MAETQQPFADIQDFEGGFSLPLLKWRELLFIGALRSEGNVFVRDMSRPLPPFRVPNLFPPKVRFRVSCEDGRARIYRCAE